MAGDIQPNQAVKSPSSNVERVVEVSSSFRMERLRKKKDAIEVLLQRSRALIEEDRADLQAAEDLAEAWRNLAGEETEAIPEEVGLRSKDDGRPVSDTLKYMELEAALWASKLDRLESEMEVVELVAKVERIEAINALEDAA